MKLYTVFFFVLVCVSCHHDQIKPLCGTPATVTDLSASGCPGLGFKLSDGKLLLAQQSFCGVGHKPDPLSNFELIAGQEVVIGYEIIGGPPCAGVSAVRVTCITVADAGEK
jgi:hypothetical protein